MPDAAVTTNRLVPPGVAAAVIRNFQTDAPPASAHRQADVGYNLKVTSDSLTPAVLSLTA